MGRRRDNDRVFGDMVDAFASEEGGIPAEGRRRGERKGWVGGAYGRGHSGRVFGDMVDAFVLGEEVEGPAERRGAEGGRGVNFSVGVR